MAYSVLRPHRPHAVRIDAAVFYTCRTWRGLCVRACVRVCVCVCVGHEGSCSRTTKPIKMLFGGTRNLGLDGFFPPTGKGNFIGGFCGLLPESNPDECTGGCK